MYIMSKEKTAVSTPIKETALAEAQHTGYMVLANTELVSELAAELGIAVRTIYKYVKDGRLRGARIGRNIKFSRANVERFLNGE
jgi:excisionase family DNA binding protein